MLEVAMYLERRITRLLVVGFALAGLGSAGCSSDDGARGVDPTLTGPNQPVFTPGTAGAVAPPQQQPMQGPTMPPVNVQQPGTAGSGGSTAAPPVAGMDGNIPVTG